MLTAPANAMITYTSQMEDEVTVTYTCEPGFGLVGNPVRTCLPGSNTWTGYEPPCQRKSHKQPHMLPYVIDICVHSSLHHLIEA